MFLYLYRDTDGVQTHKRHGSRVSERTVDLQRITKEG